MEDPWRQPARKKRRGNIRENENKEEGSVSRMGCASFYVKTVADHRITRPGYWSPPSTCCSCFRDAAQDSLEHTCLFYSPGPAFHSFIPFMAPRGRALLTMLCFLRLAALGAG